MNEQTLNAAFMSKSVDNSIVGAITSAGILTGSALVSNSSVTATSYVKALYYRALTSGASAIIEGGDGSTSNQSNYVDIRPYSTYFGLVIREDSATDKWANLQVDSVARPDKLFLTYMTNGTNTANKGVDIDVNGNMGVSGNITTTGTITAGIFSETVGNDVAEVFYTSDQLVPGDVVIKDIDGIGYIKSNKAYSKLVIGVVSDTYGHKLGGANIAERNQAIVGLAGRVNVKVTGKVEPGDLLVSSHIPGVAMAARRRPRMGTVIGKALESHEGVEVDRISMLIMNA
jgi:hypothetical protein